MNEWKVGDVVQLKSGGPAMTVTAVGLRSGASIQCHWFTDDITKFDTFPPDALKAYENTTTTKPAKRTYTATDVS